MKAKSVHSAVVSKKISDSHMKKGVVSKANKVIGKTSVSNFGQKSMSSGKKK